ncbi:Uncharacterized protein DAT39_007929, partial [Clarias magur]
MRKILMDPNWLLIQDCRHGKISKLYCNASPQDQHNIGYEIMDSASFDQKEDNGNFAGSVVDIENVDEDTFLDVMYELLTDQ